MCSAVAMLTVAPTALVAEAAALVAILFDEHCEGSDLRRFGAFLYGLWR